MKMKPPGTAKALIVGSLITKNWKLAPPVGALRGEPVAEVVQVLADLRVLEQRVLLAQLVRDHRARGWYSSDCESIAAAGLPMSGRSEPAAGVPEQDRLVRVRTRSAKATAVVSSSAVSRMRQRRRMVVVRPRGSGPEFPYVYRRLQAPRGIRRR